MSLPVKDIQLNRMQAIRAWRSATEDICIAGRGTGKTRYKAFRFRMIVENMPMSCNGIYSKTFKSLLTNTISPILEGLQAFGYHRDVHYVIGEKPPKDWPVSPSAPANFQYYISFRNGTGFRIMSEDREDSFRGPSIDSVDVDEALMISRIKFENGPIMANRGNDDKYGKVKIHHGVTMDTSMPISGQSQWLFSLGDYYEQNKNKIDYWKKWKEVTDLQYEFLECSDSLLRSKMVEEWIRLREQIQFYPTEIEINVKGKIKKITRLFTFFNAFDNLNAVGLNYIQSAKRIMTPTTFRTEMLNQRIINSEDRFYNLNDDVHLYSAVNYPHLEKLGIYNFNAWKSETSEQDKDVDPDRSLDMAIDFGKHINAMRIGQPHSTDIKSGNKRLQYRFLKSLYVKDPDGLEHLISKFTEYYAPHKRKHIRLFYDHTAVGGEGWRQPHIQDTIVLLKKAGWHVETVYIGKAPDHAVKHLLWYKLLSETDPNLPQVRFNAENDKEGYRSMQLAGVSSKRNGSFEKDKSSERSKVIPREEATDLSDAGDLLILGNYKNISQSRSEYPLP